MKIVGKERPGGIIERLNKVPALEKFIENVMENLDGELVYGDHRTDLSVSFGCPFSCALGGINFPALTSHVLGLAKTGVRKAKKNIGITKLTHGKWCTFVGEAAIGGLGTRIQDSNNTPGKSNHLGKIDNGDSPLL